MRIDCSQFILSNVIDTCSIWNLLSSMRLYSLVVGNECKFCCTQFVIYECLYKKRKRKNEQEELLKKRLDNEIKKGEFPNYNISISDLQSIEILENKEKLSMGEISSVIFAKKTQQAFITDDQLARLLSEEHIGISKTQTIPQLFGWLTFLGHINDVEMENIIKEHKSMNRQLEEYFRQTFSKGLELRLIKRDAGEVGSFV